MFFYEEEEQSKRDVAATDSTYVGRTLPVEQEVGWSGGGGCGNVRSGALNEMSDTADGTHLRCAWLDSGQVTGDRTTAKSEGEHLQFEIKVERKLQEL